jgi:hypothetical protein
MESSNKVNLDFNSLTVKIEDRSRGRMKITFKLSKEEAEGFKKFSTIKPDGLSDDQFYKHIFFVGCKTVTEEFEQYIKENKDKLEASAQLEAQKAESVQAPEIQQL